MRPASCCSSWLIAVLLAGGALDAAERPNVLLILTDDQGYGDISSHGNPYVKTPHMDRIAAEGARFERFFVSPLCAPTRAGLLTGRYHLRTGVHGVTRGQENLRDSEVTLAEIFRDAGYATGCFGKWHNGRHYPMHPNGQGFDEFVGFCGGHWNNYFDTELEHNGEPLRTEGYITDVLTDHALAFIESHAKGPFFCYVPYNAPHSPWQVPEAYWSRFQNHPDLDEEAKCAYAMVENLDDNIGRLLAGLDARGLSEQTIVLFLTDNGANSDRFNAGMRGRKGSAHEGGTRVPLFVRWPGVIPSGTVIRPIAKHVDLFPTLRELCGLMTGDESASRPQASPSQERPTPPAAGSPPSQAQRPARRRRRAGGPRPGDGSTPAPLRSPAARQTPRQPGSSPSGALVYDGRSFAGLLRGEPTNWNDWDNRILFTFRRPESDPQSASGAARDQIYRAVLENPQTGWELYDMQRDPGQTSNIAAQKPDVLARLRGAYEAALREIVPGPLAPLPIPVGHDTRPIVELPGQEAFFYPAEGQGIRYHGQSGWANDWIDHWTDVTAYPYWNLDVLNAGTYEVELLYHAGTPGSVLRLEVVPRPGGEASDRPPGSDGPTAPDPRAPAEAEVVATLEGRIDRAEEGVQVPSPDRIPRKEVYEYSWGRLAMGRIELPRGPVELRIRALTLAGDEVAELKGVRLRRTGAAGQAEAASEPPSEERPNLLVIVADDLGWGDVGYHGSEIDTPHIDRLAASGIRLEQHYVTPMCSSTRACLQSGRYSTRFGCDSATNSRVFPPGTVTLAAALQSLGYETWLSGKWHLGSLPEWGPLQHGFVRSYGVLAGGIDQYLHLYKEGPYQQTWHRQDQFVEEQGHSTDLFTREAIGWLEQERSGPFYLQVAFTAVHIPIQEPEEWIRPYRERIENESRRRFAGCCTHMDAAIGQILDTLERTGQRERTMVIFTSDNGGSAPWNGDDRYPGTYDPCPVLGNNLPLRGRKGTVYEGGIRVPALVSWPGRLTPGVRDAPMHIVDWMPTLLGMLGYESPVDLEWDGVNVWPSLAGTDAGDRAARTRTLYFKRGDASALRHGDWKLVQTNGRRELFHLAADPYETTDLAEAHPQRLTDLVLRLTGARERDRSGQMLQLNP
jgi:arylsulfatase A-like enzyme